MQCHRQIITIIPTMLLLFNLLAANSIVSANEECNLPCENGGLCKQGPAPANELSSLAFTDTSFPAPSNDTHCWCPRGYIGDLCGIQLEVCSNSEEKCIDGSTCEMALDSDGKEFYYCGCSAAGADDPQSLIARICKRASTTFCTGSISKHHCANGGNCTTTTTGDDHVAHSTCTCPIGYMGHHCELSPESLPSLSGEVGLHHSATILFLISISTVIVFLVIAILTTIGKISPENWYSNISSLEEDATDVEMTAAKPKLNTEDGEII